MEEGVHEKDAVGSDAGRIQEHGLHGARDKDRTESDIFFWPQRRVKSLKSTYITFTAMSVYM